MNKPFFPQFILVNEIHAITNVRKVSTEDINNGMVSEHIWYLLFFVTDCTIFISSMSGLVDKIKYQNNLVLGK